MNFAENFVKGILGLGLLLYPASAMSFEILIRLSGSMEYPGILSLQKEPVGIGRLCFLGEDAHGNIDPGFLNSLVEQGIPEGEYAVAPPKPEEKWPQPAFGLSGALRFVPLSNKAMKHSGLLGKAGLAVHGRDFFPLAEKVTQNPKMVRFISDQLFEGLSTAWGTLRISNWDIGRLQDFYSRNTASPEEWKVKVVAEDLKEIKDICEPLKVQRKPGGVPE